MYNETELNYDWELPLSITLTEQLFNSALQKIFIYQPDNPHEYFYYLLSSWDGENV